jgi:Cu/Ag efflux pump CusA
VIRAAEGANVNASGGVFMERGQEYLIRGIGRVQNVDDIAARWSPPAAERRC